MTPALLLDTCSIINLSYCSPVATLFKEKYTGRAGWPHAVRTELTRQRAKRPPHPQAGRACNWAVTWLGQPIALTDPNEQIAVEAIQNEISLGSDNDALDHLGEAVSIYLLASAGTGRLISDDHGARATARNNKHNVRASSTVGVLAALLARNDVGPATVDTYLNTLRMQRRMRVGLTATDLLSGNLGPWA
jgi:predicted nucleic acid-binding protein